MSTSSKPPAQSFEFTKRKRWSETLFSELSETLVFVLSPTCKVLYCGSAIVELLGWKEDHLVDADLAAFIEGKGHGTSCAPQLIIHTVQTKTRTIFDGHLQNPSAPARIYILMPVSSMINLRRQMQMPSRASYSRSRDIPIIYRTIRNPNASF